MEYLKPRSKPNFNAAVKSLKSVPDVKVTTVNSRLGMICFSRPDQIDRTQDPFYRGEYSEIYYGDSDNIHGQLIHENQCLSLNLRTPSHPNLLVTMQEEHHSCRSVFDIWEVQWGILKPAQTPRDSKYHNPSDAIAYARYEWGSFEQLIFGKSYSYHPDKESPVVQLRNLPTASSPTELTLSILPNGKDEYAPLDKEPIPDGQGNEYTYEYQIRDDHIYFAQYNETNGELKSITVPLRLNIPEVIKTTSQRTGRLDLLRHSYEPPWFRLPNLLGMKLAYTP